MELSMSVSSRIKPGPEHEVIARLVGAGITAGDIAKAIALVQSGQADLIQAAIDRRLELADALRLARQGART
jgi:hypothetical protein